MRIAKLVLISFLLMAAFGTSVVAQSLPVGTSAVEDYYRRAQLLGKIDTLSSFTVRPIFPQFINKKTDAFYLDSTEHRYDLLNIDSPWMRNKGAEKFLLLPITLQNQVNSDHPYGWNDGPMIPAKGLQTLFSAGVYFQYGVLSLQIKPEFVLAANSDFETFNPNQYDPTFARYYDIYNNIDLPVRFGTTGYKKAYWGQSSIRINYGGLSLGASSENLWWGPGIRNSLLMSNTAPGFLHATFNTTKPLKTALGSFEWQLIAGKLQNSGYPPLEPDHYYFGINLDVPKPDDWRYLAGAIITWQPKWIPGLFLGYDQASQTYGHDLHGLRDYLPLFSPIKKVSGPDNPINAQDQISSVFMRWLWAQENAEIYFEWGHYNSTKDITQSALAPERSRAYIFGLRKLLPFNKRSDENILIGIEVTQLAETSITDITNGTEWYVSHNIRQGYTNRGEVLGAGIGPGSNLQSLEVSWVKRLKKIGLQFERYLHNDDFYYYAFQDSRNYSEHWVDLSLAAIGEWNYKNFIFNGKIQGIQSINYQWALKKNGNDPNFQNQLTKFNLQVQAGVTYRF